MTEQELIEAYRDVIDETTADGRSVDLLTVRYGQPFVELANTIAAKRDRQLAELLTTYMQERTAR